MMQDAFAILTGLGWRFLWERATAVVLHLDREGTILNANRHARDLTGLPLVGQPLSAMLLNFKGELSPREWLRSAAQPRPMNIQTAQGVPQTLHVTIEPAGEDFVLFGQMNAEEHERLSRELLEINHEMSNLSRELSLKNAELSYLGILKNQFLGMAAHDLRRPLGVILNYTECLIEESANSLSPEHQEFLQTIRDSADRMSKVIKGFLDISVIEAGQLNLDVHEADIADMIEAAKMQVSFAAAKRNIRFTTELDAASRLLFVDKAMIEQVLTNLLSNAVEHSPDEGCVKILSERLATEVRISVVDEGKGVEPEQRERLFQAFASSHTPTPGGARSTGLGLTISRTIVEAHGGRMFVESEPGRGATFGFTLPIPK